MVIIRKCSFEQLSFDLALQTNFVWVNFVMRYRVVALRHVIVALLDVTLVAMLYMGFQTWCVPTGVYNCACWQMVYELSYLA